MSFFSAVPEALLSATRDLSGIGSAVTAANAAAASRTTRVLTAAEDEVSTALAALFGSHAQAYQAIGAQVSALHDQLISQLQTGAGAYATAEAVNVSAMNPVLDVINVPTMAAVNRPLIGNGANGAPGNRTLATTSTPNRWSPCPRATALRGSRCAGSQIMRVSRTLRSGRRSP